MSWTTPRTWVSGELVTAALMNTHVRDNLVDLHDNVPGCRVYRSTNQTISNNSETILLFDTERFDDDTMHSTSVNTGRITFTTAGKYHVGGHVQWDTDATGNRSVKIVLNATDTIAEVRTGAAASTTITQSVSTYYSFAAGEYIELRAFQNRGGNLDVTAAVKSSPEFWAYRRSA